MKAIVTRKLSSTKVLRIVKNFASAFAYVCTSARVKTVSIAATGPHVESIFRYGTATPFPETHFCGCIEL